MGKTTIPTSVDRPNLVIYYNDIRSINWFLNDPLVDDTTGDTEVRQKSIPIHQRRKGPSDQVPINVASHTAKYLYDPSLKSGNAKPGKYFILATDMRYSDTEAKRQFTYTGRYMDLQNYLDANIKYYCFLYSEGAARHDLAPTIGEG
jgi:hypothetical protein